MALKENRNNYKYILNPIYKKGVFKKKTIVNARALVQETEKRFTIEAPVLTTVFQSFRESYALYDTQGVWYIMEKTLTRPALQYDYRMRL